MRVPHIELTLPSLNSSIMICRVELVTLNVEFCCGYAGVMMGIKWNLSAGFICQEKLTKSKNIVGDSLPHLL